VCACARAHKPWWDHTHCLINELGQI